MSKLNRRAVKCKGARGVCRRLGAILVISCQIITLGGGAFIFMPKNEASAAGTVYYVDNNIADTRIASGVPDCANYSPTAFACGGGSASAYKTVADINAASFLPDDQILFRRGQTWREELVVPSSGTVGHPIIFGSYGSGANPILLRTQNYTAWWEYNSSVRNNNMQQYSGTANDGVSDTFANWVSLSGSGVTIEAVSPGYEGNAAVRINKPSATSGSAILQSDSSFALNAGTAYYLEFYGKRNSGANDCRVALKDNTHDTYLNEDGVWRADTDSEEMNPSSLRTTESSWTKKSKTFTTPADATSFTLQFIVKSDQAAVCEWDSLIINTGNARSTERVWAGYASASLEDGMMENGARVLEQGSYSNIDPLSLNNGYFYNYGDTHYFYYRKDSGFPVNTEVGQWKHGIYISNKSYVTVQNLDINGPGGSNGPGATAYTGFYVAGSSDNVIIKDLTASNGGEYGGWTDPAATNVTYDGITSFNNGDTGLYINSQGGTVKNCKVYDNGRLATDKGDKGGIGVYLGGMIDISNNEVYNNGPDNSMGDYEVSIVTSTGPFNISKNYVHDCIQGCIQIAEGGDGSTISYNVVDGFGTSTYADASYSSFTGIRVGGGVKGAADVKVYNNTIANGTKAVNGDNAGLSVVVANSTGTSIKNNVFYNNATPDIIVNYGVDTTTHSYSNNLFYRSNYTNAWKWKGVSQSSLAAWQTASGQDNNSFIANPLFANTSGAYANATDFRLQGASPAINAGVAISGAVSDYSGDAIVGNPDIGAFETISTPVNPNYALTVTNGTGSGSYASGTSVAISANPPASGKVFERWTGDAQYVSDSNSATTTLTMPASAISLTATYKDITTSGNDTGGSAGNTTGGSTTGENTSVNPPTGNTGSDTTTGGNNLGSNAQYNTGTLIKLAASNKVYIIIDSKKKWIPTPYVFTQLGYKWTEIKLITEQELNSIPDYEDNLIRAIGDYKVYLVVSGVKRHIPNPEVFLNYGFNWSDIKDVDMTIISKYKDTYLIREDGKEAVYYINSQGVRKHIPTAEIFNSYNDKWEDIQIISGYEMNYYPVSNLIRLDNTNDVYLIEGGAKRRVPGITIFNKYKLNWNLVMNVNRTEFDWYRTGAELR